MFQILIADSDRAYRRRLYQLLRREGYSVLQASGGEDVLKVLETSYIDFIILGDNLVDLNVYELMGQLRDTYSDMPLMLLAEKKERDGLRKSYMAGADEYLTKNVDDRPLVAEAWETTGWCRMCRPHDALSPDRNPGERRTAYKGRYRDA